MADQHTCPNGHPISHGQKYCPECGAEIDWSTCSPKKLVPEISSSPGWAGAKVLGFILMGLLAIWAVTNWSSSSERGAGASATAVPRPTVTPTLTLTELERRSTKGITFEKLARNPDTYAMALNPIKLEGEVIQIVEQSEELQMRVNITRTSYGWEDDVIVYSDNPPRSRLLEDDVIVFYARPRGMTRYETVLGATREVPLLELVAIASTNGQ